MTYEDGHGEQRVLNEEIRMMNIVEGLHRLQTRFRKVLTEHVRDKKRWNIETLLSTLGCDKREGR